MKKWKNAWFEEKEKWNRAHMKESGKDQEPFLIGKSRIVEGLVVRILRAMRPFHWKTVFWYPRFGSQRHNYTCIGEQFFLCCAVWRKVYCTAQFQTFNNCYISFQSASSQKVALYGHFALLTTRVWWILSFSPWGAFGHDKLGAADIVIVCSTKRNKTVADRVHFSVTEDQLPLRSLGRMHNDLMYCSAVFLAVVLKSTAAIGK